MSRRWMLWVGLVIVMLLSFAPVQANGVFVVGFGRYGNIALRSGNPIFAFNDISTNSLSIVRCNDPSCTSKVTTTADNTSANIGQYASMVLGPDGFPVVAYYDAVNKRPRLLDCTNADCTSFLVRKDLAVDVDLGQYISLGLTPDGIATAAYYDAASTALEVARCDTTVCATPTRTRIKAGLVGEYASLKIAADQTPYIAYYNRSTKSLELVDCTNLTCSTRNTPIAIDNEADPADVGQWASLALGLDGFPVIAYYDAFNKDLKFTDCHNTTCSNKTIIIIDSVGDVGSHARVMVRPNGRPLIAYRDATNGALKLADCEDFGCANRVLTAIDSSGSTIGAWPSMALRNDGTPVLAYSTTGGSPLYFHDTGNQTPTLTGALTHNIAPNQILSFTLAGADLDNRPVQTLTYAMYGQVPVGATLNPSSGVFSWTPTLADLGTYVVVFGVTDDGAPPKTAYLTTTITVAEVVPFNPPPVLTAPISLAVVLGENAAFTVSATDDTVVTLSASNLPAGATFAPATGAFTWLPTQAGTYPITITAIDSGNPVAWSSTTIMLTVHDQVVVNGNFEIDADANSVPDGWVRRKPSGDMRVCGVGIGGGCAYKITGGGSESSLLIQGLNATWVDVGDSITLEAALTGTGVPKSYGVVTLKIVSANGVIQKRKASIPKGTTADYLRRVSAPLVITQPVKTLTLTLMYRRSRGSVLVDDLRVIVVDGGLDPTRGAGLLPLP